MRSVCFSYEDPGAEGHNPNQLRTRTVPTVVCEGQHTSGHWHNLLRSGAGVVTPPGQPGTCAGAVVHGLTRG